MSLLKLSGKTSSPLKQLVDELAVAIKEGGSEFASSQYTSQIVAMESLNPSELEHLNLAAQSVSETLKHILQSIADRGHSLGFESLTPVQLEAGVMTALAAGNPAEYARVAMTSVAKSRDGLPLVPAELSGAAGQLDFRDDFSMEAFDQRPLTDMLPYSIIFNVQAARQDDFAEAFYPTVVVSPDNGGIDISVTRLLVFNPVRHQVTGKPTNFDQRNLLEGIVDYTVLADQSTALIPYVQESGENADKFLDPALVAPEYRKISQVDVKTAPLKTGLQIDLLGISQHPALVGAGIIDHTDAIDTRIYLERIYMQSGGATGPVIRFNVNRLPRSGFLKSIEGQNREMELNFRSDVLSLKPETTAVDGTEPLVLQPLRDANYSVTLNVAISGFAHVEFGTVQVNPSPVTVKEILDEDGNRISTDAGAGLAIVSALADLTIIGYELGACRTNSNRRSRGLLINTMVETERFPIPLGSPMSAPSPIGSERDAKDLESLVTAIRVRNSNNAVTTLLNYADTLRSYIKNRFTGQGIPMIEGIGRWTVVPYFEELDLNISDAINSVKTADKAVDISAVLVNAIRDIAYRMYKMSGYQLALDASSFGGTKPTLLVGTDPVLQRHLIVAGDQRTFSLAFEDAKVVTSYDMRMDGKIVLTFFRNSGDGKPDPLSFGTHAWIPELTSSIIVARDGATYQEAMVQPRNRWINNLPIMAVINVTGLSDVLTKNVVLATQDVTPAP